ncbi:MAG: MarR family transcriptional regulator [Balneolales bacterium]
MKLEDEINTDKFLSDHHRAVINIMFTANWLLASMNTILEPFGISEQQYNVLRTLKNNKGAPMKLYMIAERMIHRTSNVTRLVEKLRQKGLVNREVCEKNRRQVDITITEEGGQMLRKISPLILEQQKTINTKWSQAEAETIGRLLDQVRS